MTNESTRQVVVGKLHEHLQNSVDTTKTQLQSLQIKEMVNHPSHYNKGKYEVIDVIEDWKLGFHLGNALKYIARADHKNNQIEDIKKAIWYLDRYLEQQGNRP